MKRSIVGIMAAAMALAASIVWYSCTKEEDQSDEKGVIYGTVTDYATGEPIGNANVKLRPSGETTLTGNDGTFEFNDLKANKYSLSFSKAEYADLDDDYIIELEAGKKVKRDVQMRKQVASLQITNMAGEPITSLDFGADASVTSKSFNIFNNGTMTISCQLSYNCVWIDTVIAASMTISSGQTLTVTVIIDRARLAAGENRTFLHIISNNGSNELEITATGYGAPTVVTSNVGSITTNSASCGGNVTADGGSAVTDRGLCWGTNNNPTLESDSHQGNGTGTGSFTVTMSNLTPNTVYYVRAYATNARGTSYGEQRQFTTNNGLPTVTIDSVTDRTATSAVCGGIITSNGGYAVTDKGLVWSTSQYPTLTDNNLSLGSGDAPFTGSMTNLSIGTTYYVRAYATNSQGTAYSNQLPFTTNNGLPTVTTTNTTLSGGNVVSGGNVTSDGGYPVTARGICYGVYPNPDLTAAYTHTTDGTGTGYFTSVIDTTVGNTLYVRAYATNANGTSYGAQVIMNLDYLSLPTFSYNGHTYRVAPDPHSGRGETISWSSANTYCETLTGFGYSDWRMPSIEELTTMYNNRNQIGGFLEDSVYRYGDQSIWFHSYYHSSSVSTDGNHQKIRWASGLVTSEYESGYGYGYPAARCHVRPIRME